MANNLWRNGSLALLLACTALGATAGELFYRYENAEGQTVIDDHVPPQFVNKGYTVLNKGGRVVEVVPRALTDAERHDVNGPLVQERLRKEEAVRQRRYDEMLLTRYSGVADIEAAKLRKVNEIKVRINLLKGNIAGLKQQLESRQQEAADLEKDGQTVPAEFPKTIESLRQEIAVADAQITRLETERTATEVRFTSDVDRYKLLRPVQAAPQADGADGSEVPSN
jgi:uncharacterized small protein (DUF1192 family)